MYEKFGHIVKNYPLNKRLHESNVTEEGKQVQSDQWFIDGGATKHMTFQKNIVTDYKKYKKPSKIYLGDNRVIEAYGEGNVKLECCKNHYIKFT